MEVMDTGAAAFDVSGRLLYTSKALFDLLRIEEPMLDAEQLFKMLSSADSIAIRSLIATAHNAKASHES